MPNDRNDDAVALISHAIVVVEYPGRIITVAYSNPAGIPCVKFITNCI